MELQENWLGFHEFSPQHGYPPNNWQTTPSMPIQRYAPVQNIARFESDNVYMREYSEVEPRVIHHMMEGPGSAVSMQVTTAATNQDPRYYAGAISRVTHRAPHPGEYFLPSPLQMYVASFPDQHQHQHQHHQPPPPPPPRHVLGGPMIQMNSSPLGNFILPEHQLLYISNNVGFPIHQSVFPHPGYSANAPQMHSTTYTVNDSTMESHAFLEQLQAVLPSTPLSFVPTRANPSINSQQRKPRRKSKFTKEQDEIIVSMKKAGKLWVEVAQSAGIDSDLAARNRYQVLVGQQGNSSSSWNHQDKQLLHQLLDPAELSKWQFIAEKLSKATKKSFTARDCREMIRHLVWRDAASFGLSSRTLKNVIETKESIKKLEEKDEMRPLYLSLDESTPPTDSNSEVISYYPDPNTSIEDVSLEDPDLSAVFDLLGLDNDFFSSAEYNF